MDDNKELKGLVFDIQRYSIHDGPGIRTTVFLKGCPLRCFWCQNPESQALISEVFLYKEKCTLCGQCVEACPIGASFLSIDSSEIERAKCMGCGKCAEVCPNSARKLVGKEMTVHEILTEIMKDLKFYQNSGGGVTISGGEPLLQPDFSMEILRGCKIKGLHTAVETCGYVAWQNFEKVLNYVDLFLYDIKQIDTQKHKLGTGLHNDLIIENARKVSAIKPMRVRVPLIPGFNDSTEAIKAIADFAKAELDVSGIDLLAYNQLGEGKYARLGRKAVHLDLQQDIKIQELRDLVS